MSVEINWLAVLLAVVAAMVIGTIWYSKNVFGAIWMKLAGLDDTKMRKGMIGPMLIAIFGSLLTAYILAHMAFIAHSFFKNSWFMDSVQTAFWLWLGLSATSLAIHNSFERKPSRLTWLAVGNRFATYIAMGMVIGLLKP
ncbi:MAG TPA: DUF1761 domain-containing protein [Candidatus Saccharimonadales bacterium]|nr:DUF1761 domain-containing protein [Candidatus Saccharimonadales bacterium]